MQPILIVLLATSAGVPLALWLRRSLATLGYRNPDEIDLPDPGPRWWVVWTSVVAIGCLATGAVMSHNTLAHLPLIPLAVTGPWLAAVDFDVLRIPNRVLAPTALVSLLTIVGAAAVARDWRALILPLASALVTGGAFAGVHFATKGGIGFGDAKLATAIGLALGTLGAGAVWLSILAGSVTALIWAKTTRNVSPFAYGPWLLGGAWIASLAAAATS